MQKLSQISENILFYLVGLLFIFIPLYPKFPLFNIQGTFAAIRLEDILIFIIYSIWGFTLAVSNKWKDLLKDKLTTLILIFFFIGAVSTFSAIFLTHTVVTNLAILHYFRRIELIMLLPLVFSVINTKKQVFMILIILSLVVALVNIYALGQQFLHWPVVSTTNSEFAKGQILYLTPGARPNSTFAGHYDLAIFLTMVIALLSSIFFYFRNIILKIWILILGGLSGFVLILTAARVSFLATIFGILVSLILVRQRLLILLTILLAIGILLYPSPLRDRFTSSFTILLKNGEQRYTATSERQEERSKLNIPTLHVANPSPILKAIEATFTATISSDIVPGEPIDPTALGVYRSFAIRFNVEWPRAIRAFEKNPLLGSGYSSMGLATDNDFLRSLGEVGILGTVSLTIILVVVVKRLWSLFKSDDRFTTVTSAGILSLLVAFMLNGLFIDVFEASKVVSLFWMILGVGLALEKILIKTK